MPGKSNHSLLFSIALSAVGIVYTLVMTWNLYLPGATMGRNDFLALYAGARLSGTAGLYDAAAVRAVEEGAVRESGISLRYSRPPFFAFFLKPLAELRYERAYLLWLALSLSALVGFAVLWPGDARTKMIVVCWSIPACVALFNGQDVNLLLLWIGISAWLVGSNRPFMAGLILTLCASKFHLLIAVPVMIIAQKRWRFGFGFLTGALILLAVSFAAAGWDWPLRYRAVLIDSNIHPGTGHMPNIHALVPTLPLLEVLLGLVCIAAFWWRSRDLKCFNESLGLALLLGVLLGVHSYLADCALVLPSILLGIQSDRSLVRFFAIVLASPLPWILFQMPSLMPVVARLLMVALLCAMSCCAVGTTTGGLRNSIRYEG